MWTTVLLVSLCVLCTNVMVSEAGKDVAATINFASTVKNTLKTIRAAGGPGGILPEETDLSEKAWEFVQTYERGDDLSPRLFISGAVAIAGGSFLVGLGVGLYEGLNSDD